MESGEEDLRCRSLLTVCQRRLGLSEAEDTRLEKYSFLEVRFQMFLAWRRVDPKCAEGGGKPWVRWRLAPGEFVDDGSMFVEERR